MFKDNCPRLHYYLKADFCIFWMNRNDWNQIKNSSGELIEVEIEKTPLASLRENDNFIDALYVNKNYPIIEIYRYDKKDDKPINKDVYRVYENISDLIGHNKLEKTVAAASTEINDNLINNLNNHVILRKTGPGKDHHIDIEDAPGIIKVRLLSLGT